MHGNMIHSISNKKYPAPLVLYQQTPSLDATGTSGVPAKLQRFRLPNCIGVCVWRRQISRIHSVCTKAVGFGIFPAVFELLVRCAKISFPGVGGICVYFLKSVRKGRFRNVWLRGG